MPPSGQPGGGEGKRCSHCGSSYTSGHWRCHPTSGQRMCSACRAYADHHGGQLPPDSVLQQRPAEPRRQGTREEIAQRRCLQCGWTSSGSGKRACWRRHPDTGKQWLCEPCYKRIHWQLNKRSQKRRQQGQQPQQGLRHNCSETEGEQAPAPQSLPVSRKRRQEQQGPEDAAPTAFHDGPAAAAKGRADGQRHSAAGGGSATAAAGMLPQQEVPLDALAGGKDPQPAAKRQKRRKQAQPQHLPPQAEQEQPQPSLAPTVLLEGAAQEAAGSEGPAAASLHRSLVAAEAAGAATAVDQAAWAAQMQQVAALASAVPQEQLPAASGDVDVYDLLEQATDVAAAAAAGLTPELAAAFIMLLPLVGQKARRVLCFVLAGLYSSHELVACVGMPCGFTNASTCTVTGSRSCPGPAHGCRRPTCAACCSATSTARLWRQCELPCSWQVCAYPELNDTMEQLLAGCLPAGRGEQQAAAGRRMCMPVRLVAWAAGQLIPRCVTALDRLLFRHGQAAARTWRSGQQRSGGRGVERRRWWRRQRRPCLTRRRTWLHRDVTDHSCN